MKKINAYEFIWVFLENEKKKNRYINFFSVFQWQEMRKKMVKKRKKKCSRNLDGLLPKLNCEKKKLYCKRMCCIVTVKRCS